MMNIINEETETVRLLSGVNVKMSIAIYDNCYSNFTESQYFSLSNFINAGLYFPQIMQFIFVLKVILHGEATFGDILLTNIVAGTFFTLLWFWGRFYKIPGIAFLSCMIGGNFFIFFLHFVVIAFIAFFVVKDWKILLFCAIGGIITSIIKTILFGHLSSVKYHNEVVRYISAFRHKM